MSKTRSPLIFDYLRIFYSKLLNFELISLLHISKLLYSGFSWTLPSIIFEGSYFPHAIA